ncbi:hypothetical protein [Paludisphaera mucosa]|uniref:Peptidase C39-like domain-containing protein n=1 Tax=Paludisphaera mucosa TaxID=3030827 RepID=A0ABT6FD54_9BACT|nr:hypothetical protein [Paludisphaera mucosa]MDG3005514.1 hypothetical protein [Paludisphaera mucosa]
MIDPIHLHKIEGWLGSDGVQQSFASRRPTLSGAAPWLVGDEADGKPILLYKALRDVLGAYPNYPAQQIGDCVGFGHGHGLDMLQCVEIALGEASGFRESSTEFIYAISREVAGILGRRDGSYGSAAVSAMSTIGVLSREMLGSDGTYSGNRARSWGCYGVPAEIKSKAVGMRLGSSARVATWADLIAALKNGYPVTICSSLGFTLSRDSMGFCDPKGTWGHCMLIGGLRFDRPGACILQSWGPDQPTGPLALEQPSYSFWADRAAIEGILAQGDSWTLCRAPEFAARSLPEHWSYHQAA